MIIFLFSINNNFCDFYNYTYKLNLNPIKSNHLYGSYTFMSNIANVIFQLKCDIKNIFFCSTCHLFCINVFQPYIFFYQFFQDHEKKTTFAFLEIKKIVERNNKKLLFQHYKRHKLTTRKLVLVNIFKTVQNKEKLELKRNRQSRLKPRFDSLNRVYYKKEEKFEMLMLLYTF